MVLHGGPFGNCSMTWARVPSVSCRCFSSVVEWWDIHVSTAAVYTYIRRSTLPSCYFIVSSGLRGTLPVRPSAWTIHPHRNALFQACPSWTRWGWLSVLPGDRSGPWWILATWEALLWLSNWVHMCHYLLLYSQTAMQQYNYIDTGKFFVEDCDHRLQPPPASLQKCVAPWNFTVCFKCCIHAAHLTQKKLENTAVYNSSKQLILLLVHVESILFTKSKRMCLLAIYFSILLWTQYIKFYPNNVTSSVVYQHINLIRQYVGAENKWLWRIEKMFPFSHKSLMKPWLANPNRMAVWLTVYWKSFLVQE